MLNNYEKKSEFSSSETTPLSDLENGLSKLPRRAPIDIEFKDLSYSVQDNKRSVNTILNAVSGKCLSGQLTGIIGPSGAGKSTLTNILAGFRTSRISGEVLVNGKTRDLKSFQRNSCYIMQDDHLLPYLSVQEQMEFAAKLKLGGETSKTDESCVISSVLESLSLKDCRSTRVSNLSGGEKKRLSMALELINNPPVMFFDEPTSGLDSQSSHQCISLLKSLAEGGRTIICIIHQPTARMLEMFDYLFALAEGQCIYRGTIFGLVPFLSSVSYECPSYHNPADYLLEVASGINGRCIPQLVKAVNEENYVKCTKMKDHEYDRNGLHSLNGCVALEISGCVPNVTHFPDYPASFSVQFSVLFKRTVLAIFRDTLLTKLRIATHIIIGLFLGILYYNVGNEAESVLSNIGCLFFSILFLVFTAMMSTMATFPLEMKVFAKEHLNQWYSLKAYYFAKTMADIPFQIVYSIMFVVIVYFMTNQPYELERFSYFLGLCILISLVAQTIGLAIGAAFDVVQGAFVAPTSTVPFLLFAGFFVTFSSTPVYLRWLTYLSYVRYGYEGAVIAIYGSKRTPLNCSEAFCLFKHPRKILEITNIDESYLWFDFVMLVTCFVVTRGLIYFLLRWKLKTSR